MKGHKSTGNNIPSICVRLYSKDLVRSVNPPNNNLTKQVLPLIFYLLEEASSNCPL